MTLLLEELFTCPNCRVVFQSKIAASYDTFGKRYSDLYIASENDPQPILYLINICPKCGFAAFTIDFKSFEIDLTLVREAIEKTAKIVGKPPTEFNAGDGFLEIAKYSKNISLEEKANIELQACYAYRFLEDKKLKKAREITIKTINEILVQKKFIHNPEEVYLYLAGELNRLLGNNDEANKYLKLALFKSEKKNHSIKNLIIHQLSNPTEIIPKEVFPR